MRISPIQFRHWNSLPSIEYLFGEPGTRKVDATGTPSAARSKTSGNLILKVAPERRTPRPSQDLILLLQQSDAFLRISQLGHLSNAQTRAATFLYICLLEPAIQHRFADSKIPGDLSDRGSCLQSTATTSRRKSAGKGLGKSISSLRGTNRRRSGANKTGAGPTTESR